MGRTPREDVQIDHRRKKVAELYLKGSTQAAIARELGVSQPTISSDLKAIREKWTESRNRNLDEAREEQCRKLHVLLRAAWKGWQQSQEPVETTRIIQKNGETKAEKMIRKGPGDPRFLHAVQRAIEAICRLLGLEAEASKNGEYLDEEAIRKKVSLEMWDMFYAMTDPNSPVPTVIDDDYIERVAAAHLEREHDSNKQETSEEDSGTAA